MTTAIERAFINCIKDNYILVDAYLACIDKNLKAALIGEEVGRNSLSSRLAKMSKSIHITIFTRDNLFTVDDGKHFDLLIGCRPCGAEKLILESATKYKKLFVIMPCACGYSRKIAKFVKEYPIITKINAYTSQYSDLSYGKSAWIILYNT